VVSWQSNQQVLAVRLVTMQHRSGTFPQSVARVVAMENQGATFWRSALGFVWVVLERLGRSYAFCETFF